MMLNGKWVLIRLRGAHADQSRRLERWKSAPNRGAAERPPVLRLGSVQMPHAPGREPCYEVASRSAVLNNKSPHRDVALLFLKYLAGPQYSRLINEGVDALPGNPKYANLGIQEGVPDLSEVEMHRNTVASMEHGYGRRKSAFLLTTDVERVLSVAVGRLESSPELGIDQLLADAEQELITLMQRNLDRNPDLRKRYREITGTDNAAQAHRK
jgi:ABC-type glycerol-3-phosphate transport system substrate-binding protein